jgi:hypothetical protein
VLRPWQERRASARGSTGMRLLICCLAFCALLAGSAGAKAPARPCVPTVARPPYPDPAQPSFNYGNATIRVALSPPNGRIVAGRLPGGGQRATINDDGSVDAKFGWWRKGGGKIRISGRRVDGPSPPLSAHVPDGYHAGFQATGLTFPRTGCWRITGRYAGASTTFTVRVSWSRLGR